MKKTEDTGPTGYRALNKSQSAPPTTEGRARRGWFAEKLGGFLKFLSAIDPTARDSAIAATTLAPPTAQAASRSTTRSNRVLPATSAQQQHAGSRAQQSSSREPQRLPHNATTAPVRRTPSTSTPTPNMKLSQQQAAKTVTSLPVATSATILATGRNHGPTPHSTTGAVAGLSVRSKPHAAGGPSHDEREKHNPRPAPQLLPQPVSVPQQQQDTAAAPRRMGKLATFSRKLRSFFSGTARDTSAMEGEEGGGGRGAVQAAVPAGGGPPRPPRLILAHRQQPGTRDSGSFSSSTGVGGGGGRRRPFAAVTRSPSAAAAAAAAGTTTKALILPPSVVGGRRGGGGGGGGSVLSVSRRGNKVLHMPATHADRQQLRDSNVLAVCEDLPAGGGAR